MRKVMTVIVLMVLLVSCATFQAGVSPLQRMKQQAFYNKAVWASVQQVAAEAHVRWLLWERNGIGNAPVPPAINHEQWAEFVQLSSVVESAQATYVNALMVAEAMDDQIAEGVQIPLLQVGEAMISGIQFLEDIGAIERGEYIVILP